MKLKRFTDINEEIKSKTDEFIKRSKEINGDEYDYSLVDYKNNYTKVKIICPKHVIFEQEPRMHLSGQGCFDCRLKKSNTKEFIENAKKVHCDKYDYSLVDYKNSHDKVKIICSTHGVFEQTPYHHINRKQICRDCTGYKKSNTDEFIRKSKEVHDKYDYSLVDYKNNETKVDIICPVHGIFKQTPAKHINLGQGCVDCAGCRKHTNDTIIKKFQNIHGDKYDYSLLDYINNKTPVKIICNKHGVFEQMPLNHLKGQCCPI